MKNNVRFATEDLAESEWIFNKGYVYSLEISKTMGAGEDHSQFMFQLALMSPNGNSFEYRTAFYKSRSKRDEMVNKLLELLGLAEPPVLAL